ncbi:MAG: MarR family transcriptional regulator [Lachnospiraceae bacterium]|nr:MarR family transcriptional regulator [Lachnospiraceae bacterium]
MKLLKWLSVTDRFYKIYLDKQLAPFGINSSQHMFLIKICQSPGILQDSLMDMFYVHPSNIVRTVAALEKQGMITRSPHVKDKRTCELYPTKRALSVVDQVQTVCEKTEALLLQGISGSDRDLFLDLLMRAGKNITSELHIERKGEEFDD